MCLALCSQPIDPHDIIFHNNIYPPAVDDNNKKFKLEERKKEVDFEVHLEEYLVFRLVSHVDSMCFAALD